MERGEKTKVNSLVLMELPYHMWILTDEHRVQKLTFEGNYLQSVGSSKSGNGPLQFHYPKGIATTGQIFIADTCNHRIQVLNNDLTYSHSFGTKGSVPEQFNHPWELSFGNEDCYLYIVDSGNHCIKKFTTMRHYNYMYIKVWLGMFNGLLEDPTSIVIDSNLVYIAELSNHRVSILDSNGCFKYCFGMRGSGEGETKLYNNRFIRNLYVSGTDNNRLVVFEI